MADDLEAFLRQAAQRRAQRQTPVARPAAPPAATPPAAPPPQTARTTAAPAQPRPTTTQTRPATPVVPARIVPATEVSRVGTRVSTRQLEQHVEHLGEEVGQADEHMEAHITQKFDHQVGSLDLGDAAQPGATSAEPAFDIAELIAMLKDPTTVRQAVVLSEILNPPHFSR